VGKERWKELVEQKKMIEKILHQQIELFFRTKMSEVKNKSVPHMS
jgi:hypothetical protein